MKTHVLKLSVYLSVLFMGCLFHPLQASAQTPTFTPVGPGRTLVKSQSATMVQVGDTVTYTLFYSLSNAFVSTNVYVVDTISTDLTYVGQPAPYGNVSFVKNGQGLFWNFPGPVTGLSGAVTWWGVVGCPSYGIAVSNIALLNTDQGVAVSNPVGVRVNCGTLTNTPTPTITPTPSGMPTQTYTGTPIPTFTPTPTFIYSGGAQIFKSVNPSVAAVGDTVTWTLAAQSSPLTVGNLYSSGVTWGGVWNNQVLGNYSWGVSNSALWYAPANCVNEANYPQYINAGVTVGDGEFYYETLIPSLACQPLEDSILILRNVSCNRYFTIHLDHYLNMDGCSAGSGVSRLTYDKVIPSGNPCGTPGAISGTLIEDVGAANVDCIMKNTWYSVRARVCGANLMAKTWPAGTKEPSAWQMTATDSDLSTYPSGQFGFQANNGQTAFRNMTVSTVSYSSVTVTDAFPSCLTQLKVVGTPSQGGANFSGNNMTWNVGMMQACSLPATLNVSSVIGSCAAGYPVSNVAICNMMGQSAASVSIIAASGTATPTRTYTYTLTPTNTPTPTPTYTGSVPVTLTLTPTRTTTYTYTLTPTNTGSIPVTLTTTPTFTYSSTPTFTPTPTSSPVSGLSLVKSQSVSQIQVGDIVTYNLAYSIPSSITFSNVFVMDTVVTNVAYVGHSTTNAGMSGVSFIQSGSELYWSFPQAVSTGLTGSISWWGAVGCPVSGTIADNAAFSSAQTVFNSNTVLLQVLCGSPTPIGTVATATRTYTWTPTNTSSVPVTLTLTPTPTPTTTYTWTPTYTGSVPVSQTTTPTRTFTWTPSNTSSVPVTLTTTPTFTYSSTPTWTLTRTSTMGVSTTLSPTPTPGGVSLQVSQTLYGGGSFNGALTVVVSVCNTSNSTANGVTLTDVIGYGSPWFTWSGPWAATTVGVGGTYVTVGASIDTTHSALTIDNLPSGQCVTVTLGLSDYSASTRPCTILWNFLTAYGPGMSGPVTSNTQPVTYGTCFGSTATFTPTPEPTPILSVVPTSTTTYTWTPTWTSGVPVTLSPTPTYTYTLTTTNTSSVPVSLTVTPTRTYTWTPTWTSGTPTRTLTPTPSFTFTPSLTSTPILTAGTTQTVLPTVGVGCVRVQVDGKTNCNDTLPSNAAQAAIAVKIPVTPGQNYILTIVDGCISYGSNFVNGVPSSLYGTRLRVFQADDSAGTNLVQIGTVGNGSYMQYAQASIGLDQAVSLHDLSTTCEDAKSVGLSAPYNAKVFNVSKPYLYLSADDIYYGYCGDNVGLETVDVCATTLVAPSPTATATPIPISTWTPTPYGQPTATSTNTLVVTPGCNLVEVKGKPNCVDTAPSDAAEAAVAVKVPVTAGLNYRLTLMSGCISYGSDTPNGVPSSLYGTRLRIFTSSDTVGSGLTLVGHVGDGSYMQYATSGYCCNISKGVSMGQLFTTAAAAWADTTAKGLDSVVVTATQAYLYLDTDDIYLGYCGDNTGSEWVQVCQTTDPPTQGGATPTFSFTPTVTSTPALSATITPTPSTTVPVNMTTSPTVVVSVTSTPTRTFTGTSTPTSTSGVPVTLTVSPTWTAAVSVTSSPTWSPTPVGTFTPTWTNGVPVTLTASPTWTSSAVTFTSTVTSTPTRSYTFTPTLTGTPVVVLTSTPTWTQPVATLTWTQTPVGTFTPTWTSGIPVTLTASPTWTSSAVTFTSTVTSTPTRSYTFTPTLTGTPVVVLTSTPTWTRTAVRTFTPTLTNTPVNIVTATSTFTSGSTRTPTSTPTPSHICHHTSPFPNPSCGGHVSFKVDGGPYDQVILTLFTSSGRQICRKVQTCHGEPEFDLTWDLKDNHQCQVCNGIYHAFIETHCKNEVRTYKEKVVVLK